MHALTALVYSFVIAQTPPAVSTDTNFMAVFERAASMISQLHYSRGQRSQEFKARFDAYRPKVQAVKTKEEFGILMDKLIDEFQDSHFDFLPDNEQGFYVFEGLLKREKAVEMPHIGAWFRRAKEGYVVSMLMQGLPAALAGIRKGDIVTSIEGLPFTPVDSLRPFVGKTPKITYLRNGVKQTVDVSVVSTRAMQMFLDGTTKSARLIEVNGKRYGYMHLWTMGAPDFSQALDQAIEGRFAGTDGFILDLRDGFGGRPEGYGDAFFRPEMTVEYGEGQISRFGYSKPLVAIINEGTRSAKEVYAYVLKKAKRATLVGKNTAGAVLGTVPLQMNSWAYLEIPIVAVSVDGGKLEDKGVAPDIRLEEEFSTDGAKDLFLEKAISVLDSKVRG